MAKKFGRLALLGTVIGAAAAGTYYYLKNQKTISDNEHDDTDDTDDFDEELENEDFSSDPVNSENASGSRPRPHIPIDIDNAKEIIGEKVIETLDKTKEKIEHFNVSEKIDRAKEIIGEMTSATSEPSYTEMDLSALPAENSEKTDSEHTGPETGADSEDTGNKDTENKDTENKESKTFAPDEPVTTSVKIESVSSTYADETDVKDTREEFFNDNK